MKSKLQVKNILVMFAFLAGALGLVIGLNFLLKPIAEKSLNKLKVKEYSVLVDGIDTLEKIDKKDEDAKSLIEKFIAKNKEGNEIAKIYKAGKDNEYGSITISIAVDKDHKILGISSEIDQSMGVEELTKYLQKLVNSVIMDPKSNDGSSGPTVAFSLGTAMELIEEIALTHNPDGMVELDIYDELFGENHVKELEELTDNNYISYKNTIKVDDEIVGYSYYVEKNGIYESAGDYSPEDKFGNIGVEIILDSSNVLKGYKFIKYEHTKGFQRAVIKFLDELIESELNVTDLPDIDVSSGSTNSKNLMLDILTELSKYLKGGE